MPEYDALYADITVDEEITLVVRVLGPSLGVEDAASGTSFTIYNEYYDEITSNSGWEDGTNASQLQELNLAPAHSSEAATLITLTPGVYSIEAEVSGYEEKILQLELFTTDEQAFDKLGSLESWNMYKMGAGTNVIKSDVTDLTTSHVFDATDEFQIPAVVYSQSALSFLETVPVGTTVQHFELYGKLGFNADAATFSLLDGDNNNSFFTLDENGTLKSASAFDFENESTLKVQLRITDDASVSIDKNFSLRVLKDLSGLDFERLVAVRGGVPYYESLSLRFTLEESAGVVARALGPSLEIESAASDVGLDIEGSGINRYLDDWLDYEGIHSSAYADQLTAHGLNPQSDWEAAEFLSLPAGTYEIEIEDWDDGVGIAQIELFVLAEDAGKFSGFEYYGKVGSAFPVSSALITAESDEVIDFSRELRIYENEPAGTIVGKFSESDADGNTFSYSLVSGEGDGNNSLFTLESNGTLKTTSIFDYESNDLNYSIRVQSTTGGGATAQSALSIVLVDDPVDNDSDGDGLTDLEEINGYSTYELIEGSFTWEQAKADAESRGGHLATITSAEENAKVVAVANGLMVQLGASDSQDEGEWRWVTGESFDFTNWKDGEPNNSFGDEDFLVLTNTANGTQWNDQDSGNEASYILEKTYTSDPSLADTDEDGLTDGQEVNGFSQYEMIVGGFSWNQAKADAESRGGHLATITSIEEQNAVEAVWDGSVNAWLGADDVNSQNDWNWITGEPAIFSNWDSTQPNTNTQALILWTQNIEHGKWHDYGNAGGGYILEFQVNPHTDPSLADTDGDGFNDNLEFLNETDPRDEYSSPLNKGLVAWYPFDGNASDMSGNGRHGTPYNGVGWGKGKVAQALSLDGIDDYVDVGDFELGGAVTFSAWVKYDAFNYWSRIIDFGNGVANNNILIGNYQTSQASRFYHNVPSDIELWSGDFISNEWMHLAGVIQANGNMQLYLNASLSASNESTTPLTTLIGPSSTLVRVIGQQTDTWTVWLMNSASTVGLFPLRKFPLFLTMNQPPGSPR